MRARLLLCAEGRPSNLHLFREQVGGCSPWRAARPNHQSVYRPSIRARFALALQGLLQWLPEGAIYPLRHHRRLRGKKDSLIDTGRTATRSGVEVRQAASVFAQPIRGQGALQLLTSFGPFIAACMAMYLVYPISLLLTLALAVPAGVLLVRVFIVQHDCGHGSFFASTRANSIVGWACSLLTLTPFTSWARQHSLHHGSWSNLDRRKGADLYSACLTVNEYHALSRWRRLVHRLARHPLVANVLLPPLVFIVLYRVPFDTPRSWRRERHSVYLTNAALLALFCILAVLTEWREVLA